MKLSLHEIIEMPGSRLPFSCAIDTDRISHPSIAEFSAPPVAVGEISNIAGALSLSGELKADLLRVCDRCGLNFKSEEIVPLYAKLAESLTDEDNAEIFLLDGNWLDLSDVIETCFILSMDSKCLCKEDCFGLCPACGKNLNEGPCACPKEIDPRLAVLAQLLEEKDKKDE